VASLYHYTTEVVLWYSKGERFGHGYIGMLLLF